MAFYFYKTGGKISTGNKIGIHSQPHCEPNQKGYFGYSVSCSFEFLGLTLTSCCFTFMWAKHLAGEERGNDSHFTLRFGRVLSLQVKPVRKEGSPKSSSPWTSDILRTLHAPVLLPASKQDYSDLVVEDEISTASVCAGS